MAHVSNRKKYARKLKRSATQANRVARQQEVLLTRFAITLYTVLAKLGGEIEIPVADFGKTVASLATLGYTIIPGKDTTIIRLVTQ